MGMGRASGGQMPTQQSGMGGKGGQQPMQSQRPPMGGMGGKGGQMPPQQQGGMGGKGGGQPVRDLGFGNGPGNFPKQGGMGGKGGAIQPANPATVFPAPQGGMSGMGGKGQPAQYPFPKPSNVLTYAQPYMNDMIHMVPPQPKELGAVNDGYPLMQQPPGLGPLNAGRPDVAMPSPGGFSQQLANGSFANQMPQDNSPQAYRNFMALVNYAPGTTPPTYEQWAAQRQQSYMPPGQGVGQFVGLGQSSLDPVAIPYNPSNVDIKQPPGQQLAPGAVAPTQAEIDRIRPMLSTPAQPVAAPKPFMAQPVQAEAPRQVAQRGIQQLANAKRLGMK